MPQENSTINGFTPDQALDIFSRYDLDKVRVRGWVYAKLHPSGFPACPACDQDIKSERALATYIEGGRVCCPGCKKFFTNRTNTILHGSQLDFEQVFMIAIFTAFSKRTGADPAATRRELSAILGLHQDTIKTWQDTLTALETPLV